VTASRKPRTTKTTSYPRGWRRHSSIFGGPRYRYVHTDAKGNRTISHGGPISNALGWIIGIPLAIAAPFVIVWALISGAFHIVLDADVNTLQQQLTQQNGTLVTTLATAVDQALYTSNTCDSSGNCSSGPQPNVTVTSIDPGASCSSGGGTPLTPNDTPNTYTCFVGVQVSDTDGATTLGGTPASGSWTVTVPGSCSDSQGNGCSLGDPYDATASH
jgi:hypothetical protein